MFLSPREERDFVLPEHGRREVYVVTELAGSPLPEKEAPARLIVIDEEKASRSLYGISSITVLDLSTSPEGREHPGKGSEGTARQF